MRVMWKFDNVGWEIEKEQEKEIKKEREKEIEKERVDDPLSHVCLDGICKGKNWSEAREIIVNLESEEYWSKWTGKVGWEKI